MKSDTHCMDLLLNSAVIHPESVTISKWVKLCIHLNPTINVLTLVSSHLQCAPLLFLFSDAFMSECLHPLVIESLLTIWCIFFGLFYLILTFCTELPLQGAQCKYIVLCTEKHLNVLQEIKQIMSPLFQQVSMFCLCCGTVFQLPLAHGF